MNIFYLILPVVALVVAACSSEKDQSSQKSESTTETIASSTQESGTPTSLEPDTETTKTLPIEKVESTVESLKASVAPSTQGAFAPSQLTLNAQTSVLQEWVPSNSVEVIFNTSGKPKERLLKNEAGNLVRRQMLHYNGKLLASITDIDLESKSKSRVDFKYNEEETLDSISLTDAKNNITVIEIEKIEDNGIFSGTKTLPNGKRILFSGNPYQMSTP